MHRQLSVLLVEGYRLADPDCEVLTREDGTLSSYRGSGGVVATLQLGDLKRINRKLRTETGANR